MATLTTKPKDDMLTEKFLNPPSNEFDLPPLFTLGTFFRSSNVNHRRATVCTPICVSLYFPRLLHNIWDSSELIMAVGLVVDYMVHIVHFFLHQAS